MAGRAKLATIAVVISMTLGGWTSQAVTQTRVSNDQTLVQGGDLARFLDRLDSATTNIKALLAYLDRKVCMTEAEYRKARLDLNHALEVLGELRGEDFDLRGGRTARGVKNITKQQHAGYLQQIMGLEISVLSARSLLKRSHCEPPRSDPPPPPSGLPLVPRASNVQVTPGPLFGPPPGDPYQSKPGGVLDHGAVDQHVVAPILPAPQLRKPGKEDESDTPPPP